MKLELRMSQAEEQLEKILKELQARRIPLNFFKKPNPLKLDAGAEVKENLKTSGPIREPNGETAAASSTTEGLELLSLLKSGLDR